MRRFIILFTMLHVSNALAADQPLPPAAANKVLVVTPQGPADGGDFGPKTPGTKTSGLQEAFDAAKAQAKDLYIVGGSWTTGKTEPIVYFLDATLHIPWMQNFRLDGGHYVINYNPQAGNAVVFDSQMSCAYRFGLIVSNGDGATVALRPQTAGPDGFKVITSTEFTFNAIVGGGGAWPGGKAGDNELNPKHEWKGVGLLLDGQAGSIDANKITVIETVGCHAGLLLTGAVTRNTIEETNIHLCREHIVIGSAADTRPSDNRIEAFCDSQGITPSTGARVFGSDNLLTLSVSRMSAGNGLILEKPATRNLIISQKLPDGVTVRADQDANQIIGPAKIVPTVTDK